VTIVAVIQVTITAKLLWWSSWSFRVLYYLGSRTNGKKKAVKKT